ncbi:MAG: alanine--tRNA ligase [Armatimonadaceae bacterium]
MEASELRRAYLDFFASKGALILPSDSLVTEDPTLLFTVAGMVPFKAYFEDRATPPRTSVVTSQKCLRTKDIDDIGDTSHCTFFEMLGNFSFGDYFKPEAVEWSAEFLFDVLKIDRKRIRVTVYQDDDDAYALWKKFGMPDERITRLGQKTNYWPANAIVEKSQGPCGPCSEIFFDLQPELPFDSDWDGEGSRWLEIWNNVFTQFTGVGTGSDFALQALPKKNIDTGMGLERTAAAINDLAGPFETDVIRPIITHLENLSGKSYTSTPHSTTDIAFRRIADHIRATTFLIGDGVLPDKDKHGYVLRRLMRRAIVAGIRHLGFDSAPFMDRAVPGVISHMKDAYPDLVNREEAILAAVRREEAQFREILSDGLGRLDDSLTKGNLSGAAAFDLFATYGLPFEVTREVAGERGVTIDEESFNKARAQHAIDSGKGNKKTWIITDENVKAFFRELPHTEFTGYVSLESTTTVAGILVEGQPVTSITSGVTADVVLSASPFYAESGGQVSDTGELTAHDFRASVLDVTKKDGVWFHTVLVHNGSLTTGATVHASVDANRRRLIRANHTSTHILHRILREQLGTHVAQRGSLVAPERLRFDFSHGEAIPSDKLKVIERLANDAVAAAMPVEIAEKPIDEARELGAMMLFGEKYGDVVRVVSVGGEYSREFCGGTHVANTSEIGMIKIVGESSSAAGVRRIEAITSDNAMEFIDKTIEDAEHAAGLLNVKIDGLAGAIQRLLDDRQNLATELKLIKQQQAGNLADGLLSGAVDVNGTKVIVQSVDAADAASLASLVDELIGRTDNGIVMLIAPSGDKVNIVVKATKTAVAAGVHCGNLAKQAAQLMGGGGGGRPDFASAGGKNAASIPDALSAVSAAISSALGS